MVTRRRINQAPVQTGPDWSLLPAELIQLVSEKVGFKEQYSNLRLVCREWRHACPPHPRHLIGQIPWLWLPRDPSSSTLSFYDFSQSKVYKLYPPYVIGKDYPCSRGWFLREKDLELSLFNPITGETKRNCLPSLAAPPTILEFARNDNTEDLSQSHFDIHEDLSSYKYEDFGSHICRIILTSSPYDEGCIVVAKFVSVWELGFCKVGDSSWTILELKDSSCGIVDIKHRNGLVYAMHDRGQITVYDLRQLSRRILIGNLSYVRVWDDLHLVIGEGEHNGLPLLVRHIHRMLKDEFQVYKCTHERGRSRWRRITNIGNAVLLLSERQCEMVPIDDIRLNGWEGNYICGCTQEIRNGNSKDGINIKMISIENGSIKRTATFFGGFPPGSGFSSLFTPSSC